MLHILVALLVLALGLAEAKAQSIADAWIDITDPVLEPTAPHVIARHYKLWDGRPNCGPGETARLVVAFHGGLGNANKMATEYLTPPAVNKCYVIAYPSGSNKGQAGVIRVSGDFLLWNISAPLTEGIGWPAEAGVNDDLFVDSLVATLKAQYSLTTAFAVGVSMGGMLAFHQACDTANFAALATVATTIFDDTCDIAYHIPNLHIHGTADSDVCWLTWYSSCEPWPKARPVVLWWQAQDGPHEKHILLGGTHAWQPTPGYDTTGTIWTWLDSR